MTTEKMDAAPLIEGACQRVGADDFGADTWQEGLDVLVTALNRDAELNDLGRAAFADLIIGNLANRLEIEQWYAQYPEINEQEIVAPLFGIGLPRTGSTALSALLACDDTRRPLRTWEAGRPCPPPESATADSDPRIAEAQAGIDITNEMFPGFVGLLPTSAVGPQECILLMAMDFRSQMFEGLAFIPTYNTWLMQCDMKPAYRFHERVLKLLQWHCPPNRWWLKSPAHMHSIEALNAVYPTARFVMTHRDVTQVLPSVCGLTEALSSILCERPDPTLLGPHNAKVWAEALRRFIDFRNDNDENRFFDVSFLAMQQDPIGAVEHLYGELGDDFSVETRHRMQAWWETNAADRKSIPQQPERFGLDMAAMRQQFAFYHDRFVTSPTTWPESQHDH
jgi:Sulfotransferase family